MRFCTFSTQIHVVNFDPWANLNRTYEENIKFYIWITKGYYYEIGGTKIKTLRREKLYARAGGGGGGGCSRLQLNIKEGVIDNLNFNKLAMPLCEEQR